MPNPIQCMDCEWVSEGPDDEFVQMDMHWHATNHVRYMRQGDVSRETGGI